MEIANMESVISMNSASYFDLIPADVLANVARFLSNRPNSLDWARYLSPNDVIRVSSARESLRCAVGNSLNCIKSGNMFDKCTGCNLSPLSYRTCRCLGTGERAVFTTEDPQYFSFIVNHYNHQFVQLVSYLGAFVSQIDFPSGQTVTEEKAAAIMQHCSAMTDLNIYDRIDINLLRSIIERRGARLNKFRCNWNLIEVIPTIATHCSNLRELCLRSAANLDAVLTALGARLTALEIQDVLPMDSFRIVRDNCPKLRTIRVFCNPALYEVAIAFYRSYGPQLGPLSFFAFNADQCRRVLDVCTNAEVTSINVDEEAGGDAIFAALQKRVVHMANVDYEAPLKGDHHLSTALNKCVNIIALNIYGRSDEEDDGIDLETFRLSMPTLQKFSMDYLRPKEIIDMAQSTSALKTLRIFIDFDEESHEDLWKGLGAVVRCNPGLEQVKIHVLNFWCMGHSNTDGGAIDDEDDDDEHMWDEEQQRFIPPAPRPQRVPDEIPLGVSDPDGERFLFHLLGAFYKADNLRELIVVSYPNVNEYWDYMYCVEDACTYFGLRHRRLSLAVLGVDYLPLEVYHSDDHEDENVDFCVSYTDQKALPESEQLKRF